MTKSLSGHSLIGDKLTKFVYLDETGTNKRDPWLVAAGILIDPDAGLSKIEQSLKEIAFDLIPSDLLTIELAAKGSFCFHAVDFMNGNKIYKPYKEKEEWTFDDGYAVAEAIIAAMEDAGAAVVWGTHSNSDENSRDYRHSYALAKAMKSVELYMLQNHARENCIVIAENIEEHKKALKQMVNTITNPLACLSRGLDSPFPLRTIRDTVHFVSKRESFGCQVADTVCYILKKAIDDDSRYYELRDRVISLSIKA